MKTFLSLLFIFHILISFNVYKGFILMKNKLYKFYIFLYTFWKFNYCKICFSQEEEFFLKRGAYI